MNTKVMFSSNSDEWATPEDFFNMINQEFHFNLDPCATSENHKCEKFFTMEQNGLNMDWGGGIVCFAIHHIQTLQNGLRSVTKKAARKTHLCVC